MKVTMFWYGGSSYGMFDVHDPKDALVFNSIREAKDWFAGRPGSPYTPCVSEATQDNEGPVAWLFFGDTHPVIGEEYPDCIITFGPRGGVRVEKA